MSDSIVKIAKRDRNFTAFNKEIMGNPNISFRAKGLFAYLMGLPDDWTVRVNDILHRATEGRDALRSAFKELYDAGYAEREAIRNEDGTLSGTKIIIYETTKQKTENKQETKSAPSHKVYAQIPKELSGETFVKAWKEWIEYRNQRKSKLTPLTMKKQLNKLAPLGTDKAIKTIERSIENGWLGLFTEDKSGKPDRPRQRIVC